MIFQNFSLNIYPLMMRALTLNTVIKSLYKESSLTERRRMRFAAGSDPVIRDEIRDLRMAWKHLPKVTFSPPQHCLNNIMSYSKKNAVETSF